jgi:HK97 gp10 family phage protein
MATFRIDIRGDKEVMAKLNSLVPKMRKRALTRSIRAAMKPVLTNAKSNAPKGDTGQLRKSVKLRAMKRNRRGIVGIHVSTSDKAFQGDQFYGGFQEFGWHVGKRSNKLRKRGKWSGIGTEEDERRMVSGKHFIEEAYSSSKKQTALETFKRQFAIEFDRVVKGG